MGKAGRDGKRIFKIPIWKAKFSESQALTDVPRLKRKKKLLFHRPSGTILIFLQSHNAWSDRFKPHQLWDAANRDHDLDWGCLIQLKNRLAGIWTSNLMEYLILPKQQY